MSRPTLTFTISVNHPNRDAILRLVEDDELEEASPAVVLERLVASDLNPGEHAILEGMCKGEAYGRLVERAGNNQKLGSIIAGLNRRWKSRGGSIANRPWSEAGGNWVMAEEACNFLRRRLVTK